MKRTKKALKKREQKRKQAHKGKKLAPPPIPDNIIEFVTKYRILKKKPYSLRGREMLCGIYQSRAQQINIVKARQMGLTVFAENWLLHHLLKYPGTSGLYTSDRMDHVLEFSRRIKEAIKRSPKIKLWALKMTNLRIDFVNGSTLHMVSSWNGFEEARGFAIDFAVVDEAQSSDLEALPVLKETLSASIHKRLLVIGTGSLEGDEWWKEWHRGTQFQWQKASQVGQPPNLPGVG